MVEELVEEVEEEVKREKEEKEKKVTKVVEEEVSHSQTGGRAILASCPLPHTLKLVLSFASLLSSELT